MLVTNFFFLMEWVKLIETGSRMVVARGYWEGDMGSCLMDSEFQFCKMEKF